MKTMKISLLKQNAEIFRLITVNHLPVEEVKESTYLGSTATADKGSSLKKQKLK